MNEKQFHRVEQAVKWVVISGLWSLILLAFFGLFAILRTVS